MKTSDILSRDYTDLCKLFACVLVVTAHYCQYLIYAGSDTAIVKALCAQCGKIGVAIFFFLSGYGIMESYKKKPIPFLSFVRKRFFKIYLPALLSCLLLLSFTSLITSTFDVCGGGGFAIK